MDSHIKCPNIPLPHLFFSNEGGVSSGLYTSLNCGPGSKDTPAHIRENRCRAAKTLTGSAITPLLSLYQHHSSDVLQVTEAWDDKNRPKADAMVTATPGLILGILTADCTPVLFADAEAGVIGAAHAGWKGAFGGILANTLQAMEKLGAERQRITAAIGPTIHRESYEVSHAFTEQFIAKNPSHDRFFSAGKDQNHAQFDLPAFVEEDLINQEVKSIWAAGIDTYKSPHHFSYRRTTHKGESDYGRQLSAIILPI